jgi:cAMP-specific phosphodiesterase 4
VARIVKQVTGKNDLEVDEGAVDKDTAVWLSENFSNATKNKSAKAAQATVTGQAEYNVDSAQEQLRLMEGHSTVDPTIVNSWNFDVLKYTTPELCEVCSYLFDVFHLQQEFKIPQATMLAFLSEMSGRYNPNPYHNFAHAVDVTQTLYRVIMVPGLNLILSPLDILSLLVGAIGHDVGHPGVNNAFLVKVKHELAMTHNDK